jgi:hypothetical protein
MADSELNNTVLECSAAVYDNVSSLDTGFGLIIGFIELVQIVATSSVVLLLVHTLSFSLQHLLILLNMSSLAVARLWLPR